MKFQMPEDEQRQKGRDNAARVLERKDIVVSGEWVSTADLMRRLGTDRKGVQRALRRARAAPGPVTWEGLGA